MNDPAFKYERLPKTLREATMKMMAPKSIARIALGDEFVDHFAMTRLHECKQWDQAVTNWEVSFAEKD
jgi:glutamine synthetase